jgi:hypothetical protein
MQQIKIEAKVDVPDLGLKKGDILTAFEAYLYEAVPGRLNFSYFLVYLPQKEVFMWAATDFFKFYQEVVLTFPGKKR